MTTNSSERILPAARHTGERAHAIIWSKRMKQGDVARAVGVSGSTFSKKLRGEVPITVDELMRIAGVLGVDPGDLLPRLDSNQQPSGYVSLQVGDVIPLSPRLTIVGKAPPRQIVGNTSPAVGERRSNTSGRLIGQGVGRGGRMDLVATAGGARGLHRVE